MYMVGRTKAEIVRELNEVQSLMTKHQRLAMFGKVDSGMRLVELRKRKKGLQNELACIR